MSVWPVVMLVGGPQGADEALTVMQQWQQVAQ